MQVCACESTNVKRGLSAQALTPASGIDLALTPTDNFISEFVPDIASHIHVQAVFVQRIITR